MKKLLLAMMCVGLLSCSNSNNNQTIDNQASSSPVSLARTSNGVQSVDTGASAPVTQSAQVADAGYLVLDTATQANVNKLNPVDVAPGKVKIVEFFSYACIHCYHVESQLDVWMAKHPNVEIQRVHVVWGNDSFKSLAKLNYTVKTMNLSSKINVAIFKALFEEKLDLTNEAVLRQFLVKQGVDTSQFFSIYNSFGASNIANSNDVLTNAYGINNTPTFVVDNKYMTKPELPDQLLQTLSVLVKKESK